MLFKTLKIGLALGGGGSRGFAHAGVIQILEREKIPIDFIAGTSAGSIVGACYALHQDSEQLMEQAKKLATRMNENTMQFSAGFGDAEKEKKVIFWGKIADFIKKGHFLHTELTRTCLNDGIMMIDLLKEIFGDRQFKDTRIPFCVVAADLISGKEVILKEGLLWEAVLASCTIPGVFPPVQFHSQLLVDGGIVNAVPIDAVDNLGADFVIAVNISRGLKRKKDFRNAIDILLRSDAITSNRLRRIQLGRADFVISPQISHIDWWNFSKPELVIKRGTEAAEREIEGLKKAIRDRQAKTKWSRLLLRH